ncbi:Zinc-regulated transporter 2 [Fulvia fulva]|uniref:Zinc-regulated transporter 2 n=1 Tax=Passalora fulva TaxID=5499 RepID=A0A9Q8P2V7_PASFU|nr:Zinc-regulated transporter 2 [Fulvia fulva]KAK4634640.1 Zinc-regulated transporter 2 [Fulvia fulva]KAK4636699.1 Zinc-regulated transporter 2 [Fulvia fulva]UJO11293.1 Zinc-regulated transporter 2 [Fulvia fulva]WPV09378.1 Zinc-regulated transporter 2 [Fulvia fulva]WPV23365.1 Zinc-regulated transporter 2 [Fulvia fulva]
MTDCTTGNEFDGRLGVRISSIVVIFIGSALGALFPVWAANHKGAHVPEWTFFVAKYFGSGVIVATAFIHLLAPAHEALTNECLTGPITEYDWVEGICLISIFFLFIVEVMVMRFAKFGHSHSHDHGHGHDPEHGRPLEAGSSSPKETDQQPQKYQDNPSKTELSEGAAESSVGGNDQCPVGPYAPGDDHLSHAREHVDSHGEPSRTFEPDSYTAQMTALFILEFGVVFHSVFIGLTLAVAGSEFITLYVVLVFHQTFEGLALGSRLGTMKWPRSKWWTPYLMGLGYAVSTPIAIAIGLGVRKSFNPEGQTALIANGIFDSLSAGILIYTGLVELMAHEFMFSSHMQKAPMGTILAAIGWMLLGALLMSILGKWA